MVDHEQEAFNQRRILIFGALGYFKLEALQEGRGGRFSDFESAPVPNV